MLEVRSIQPGDMVTHIGALISGDTVFVAPSTDSRPRNRPLCHAYLAIGHQIHERAVEQLEAPVKLRRVCKLRRKWPTLTSALFEYFGFERALL